uniref:Dickkopf-related protein 1-like n=1 Tax=Scleropages formosus TaxID=113540 RepID=A0A8C9RHH7_SCLFO
MLPVSLSVFLALCVAPHRLPAPVHSEPVLLHSNVIKNPPGGVTHLDADVLTLDIIGHQNIRLSNTQTLNCGSDQECGLQEYCSESRGSCVPCRRRRKRCSRHAMCCAGNRCNNGELSSDGLSVNFAHETSNYTLTILTFAGSPGLEGETCLRSTDCSKGLCCARHFWSRICKPVLTEGQVCTKHKKKGTHGLEIFQRCNCGDGLACRVQKGDVVRQSSRTLHTCQRR